MKIVSVREMRKIDRIAIKELGIPGVVLMENAGQSVVSAMEDYFEMDTVTELTVVCGKGNNGGDGFVVSRYLLNQGKYVDIFIIGDEKDIKGDAKKNLDILKGIGVKPKTIRSAKDLKELSLSLLHSEIVVDAIFGTGFKGEIAGISSKIVVDINESGLPIVSVDTPSGIDSNTGQVSGVAVKADMTVTMGLPKMGQFLYPAKNYVGELYVADIGFPEQVIDKVSPMGTLVDKDVIKRFIPWRASNSHKGAFGRILIIAGSTGMTGAAAMTANSALRAGAGLVYLAIPEHLNPILEEKCTETITIPVSETAKGSIGLEAYKQIMEQVSNVDVLAIGPGMSRNAETQKLIRKVVKDAAIPLLVDADGINAFEGYTDILKKRKKPTILTPHPGEMARLIESSARKVDSNRLEIAQRYASKWGIILVLKGVPTIISKYDGAYWLNNYANSGLATGGSGDVLSGLIIGFLAQKTSPLAAAVSGVYIHASAGEILKEKMGEHSIIASDLLDAIPAAIMKVLKD